MFSNEASRSQIEDQRAIELLVEAKVEVVQGFLRVAELGLFLASLQQSITPAREFIGDQAGDQIDGCHRLGLSLE